MVALGEAEGGLDLEAMRVEDSSWHPCRVSLSSDGVGIIICFENGELKDMKVNSEEALACLRFRSAALEGDDCSSMKEGDRVLAADKSKSKNLFYDAEVEEVIRVKHSKRVFCRCTFSIKWLHRDLNGENLTVPSSSIMKLATKSVDLHPTVDKFLNTIRNIDSPASSPFSTVLEDLNSEIDINKLIDQQIEQIANAVDASEGIARDILLGVKGDIEGEIRSKRNSLHDKARDDQNHFRRSTRSSKRLVNDDEVEDAPAPSTEEKHESMSQLTPLAARARLASFAAINGTRLSDFLANDKLYVKNKLSPASARLNSGLMAQLPEPSSESSTFSIVEKKSSQTVQKTRVIHSRIKTGDGTQTSNVDHKMKSTNGRRLTRSTILEEKEVGENSSNHKGSLSEKSNSASGKKKPVSSTVDADTNVPFTVQTSRQAEGYVDEVVTATANSGRLTSSSIREGKTIPTWESRKGLEETSTAVETQQTEGNGTGSGKQKRKSVSSHKQERRFSPRNHSCGAK